MVFIITPGAESGSMLLKTLKCVHSNYPVMRFPQSFLAHFITFRLWRQELRDKFAADPQAPRGEDLFFVGICKTFHEDQLRGVRNMIHCG